MPASLQNLMVPQTSGKSSQPSGGFDIGKLMGNKVTLKYNDDYSFNSRIYMIAESYDKKDVIKMEMYMYYSSTSPSVGVETKSISSEENGTAATTSTMVMDGENKCFIVLTEINASKMGIISPVQDENTAQTDKNGKPVKKTTPPVFTKTGNSRVVAGYYGNTEFKDGIILANEYELGALSQLRKP